uniref:WAP domain-containing protein n=1 Tax=Zonotrichia albicollis TaxID=44394 RepID=A0A8D2MB39_ZONAL
MQPEQGLSFTTPATSWHPILSCDWSHWVRLVWCEAGDSQKPGQCPRDFMRCLHLESPLCANDSSCPAGLKCCLWECRLRCIPPAEGTAPRWHTSVPGQLAPLSLCAARAS